MPEQSWLVSCGLDEDWLLHAQSLKGLSLRLLDDDRSATAKTVEHKLLLLLLLRRLLTQELNLTSVR